MRMYRPKIGVHKATLINQVKPFLGILLFQIYYNNKMLVLPRFSPTDSVLVQRER